MNQFETYVTTNARLRDAVRCVKNDFKGGHSLAAIRCPTGLVFNLDGQTCDWANKVQCTAVFWRTTDRWTCLCVCGILHLEDAAVTILTFLAACPPKRGQKYPGIGSRRA